jgi:mannose-6-phosphate isomerase-like protein (cupin superfamily)
MAENTIQLSSHQILRIILTSPERLEMEATWQAGSKPPPMHWHPTQHERFEVLEGELTVELSGEPERVVRSGEALDVPPRTGHRMWNAGEAPVRASWVVTPALRTEKMLRGMGGASKVKQGTLILRFRDEFRLGGSPD